MSTDWTSTPSINTPSSGISIDWTNTSWDLMSPLAMPDTSHSQELLELTHVVSSGPDHQSEQYHGPLSLLSLLRDTDDLLLSMLHNIKRERSDNLAEMELLTSARSGIQLLITDCRTPTAATDADRGSSQPVPLSILLKATMGPYFEHVNPLFPAWTQCGFQRLIHASHEEHDDPWLSSIRDVAAKSMILLTLTAMMPSQSCGSLGIDEMDSTIHTLVADLSRAINMLELFMSPRLANIQALVSMVSTIFRPPSISLKLLGHQLIISLIVERHESPRYIWEMTMFVV